MESVINQKIKKLFPECEGAFLFGSRADGYYNKDSDWDIGILGGKKSINYGKFSFLPIKFKDLEKRAVRNIHDPNISIFSKLIVPLINEKLVRKVEKRTKLHIINYCFQKFGKNLTGKEILLNYLKENATLNPVFKPSYIRFINSGKLDKVTRIYDKLIENYDFNSNSINYRRYRKIDSVVNLSLRTLNSFISRGPVETLSLIIYVVKRYSKVAKEARLHLE